jgi:hypothetical protein
VLVVSCLYDTYTRTDMPKRMDIYIFIRTHSHTCVYHSFLIQPPSLTNFEHWATFEHVGQYLACRAASLTADVIGGQPAAFA